MFGTQGFLLEERVQFDLIQHGNDVTDRGNRVEVFGLKVADTD